MSSQTNPDGLRRARLGRTGGRVLLGLAERPARMTALAFGSLALVGAVLLRLPVSLREPHTETFVDSLFTAVSAVCVTGLVVQPTGTTYTAFGQAVILGLFQIGGLGIMALYVAFSVLAGRKLRMRSSVQLAEMMDAPSLVQLRQRMLSIVRYSIVIELTGTLALYLLFARYPDVALSADAEHPLSGAGSRLWAALFHAVSAFCNAGFSVFAQGAEPFADDWGVSCTLMALIVVGGLGFPVLSELQLHALKRWRGQRPPRLSLHCRSVLLVSALLTVLTALCIGVLELDATLADRPWPERVLTSLFQSVTARTAGFNTLPIGELSAASAMMLCLVMFIGASPGSTGGGIKTTTAAVLFATFRSELMGHREVRLMDRWLGVAAARRAVSVSFLAVVLVSLVLLCLLAIESLPPLDLAFEVFSAFGTVGLSTGVTPRLSTTGKLIIALTMFVGRIGPLTLALALAAPRHGQALGLAREDVTIG